MPAHEETYKGQKIVIEEPEEGEPQLLINDQDANVIHNADGTYSSESLFYTKYSSLRELARAQIDELSKE
jgi:hypothetical protein